MHAVQPDTRGPPLAACAALAVVGLLMVGCGKGPTNGSANEAAPATAAAPGASANDATGNAPPSMTGAGGPASGNAAPADTTGPTSTGNSGASVGGGAG